MVSNGSDDFDKDSDDDEIQLLIRALGESADTARRINLPRDRQAWVALGVLSAPFENFLALQRAALEALLSENAGEELRRSVLALVGLAVSDRCAAATFAITGFVAGLSACGRLPVGRAAAAPRLALLAVCRAWVDAGALTSTVCCLLGVARRAGDDNLPATAATLCARWLCAFSDLLMPLCDEGDVLSFWSEAYPAALVSAFLRGWHERYHTGENDYGLAPDIFTQLSLRGETPRLAAGLCASYLLCDEQSRIEATNAQNPIDVSIDDAVATTCRFAGTVLDVLSSSSVAVACSLTNGIIDACEAVIALGIPAAGGGARLLAQSTKGSKLLEGILGPCLRPLGCGCGSDGSQFGVIEHFLTDRFWRLTKAIDLDAAVVFSIVDILHECCGKNWLRVRGAWFERWADATMLRSADLRSERSLALRIGRSLVGAATPTSPIVIPSEPLDGRATHLLLRGVHLRLGAPVPESRHFGMAVAEILARLWPQQTQEDGKTPTLKFDNFDLDKIGLSEFHLCDASFIIDPEASTFLSGGRDGAASAFLRKELVVTTTVVKRSESAMDYSKADEPFMAELQNVFCKTREDVGSACVSTVGFHAKANGGTEVAAAYAMAEADSDDEDADDPLRGLDPLPSLPTPVDACEDLRLASAPQLLQSAYEMLLGPAKDQSARDALAQASAQTAADDPSRPDAPELPTVARARLVASLNALPGLIDANPPELPRLCAGLCTRLLHMSLDTLGAEDVGTQRLASLVALLVADCSRRVVVKLMIVDFGADDSTIAARLLILNALSDAARRLSNNDVDAPSRISTNPVPKLGAINSETMAKGSVRQDGTPKTRRFASATRTTPSLPNRFASEMRHFLLPLLARWQRCDSGAAHWAAAEPTLIGPLLQCAGVLIECAGHACPDRDRVARQCLDVVEEFVPHADPYVRRCALFLFSRIILVRAEQEILARELLIDSLALRLAREGDGACRKMLAGILTWYQQSGFYLQP